MSLRTRYSVAMAAIAASMLVVAFAAGPASGTELCAEASYPCEEPYPSGTDVEAQLKPGTEATFTISAMTIKCNTSTIKGETLAAAGTPLSAEITSVAFSECGTVCQAVEALSVPWEATIEAVEAGEGDGTLTVVNPEVKLKKCTIFNFSCTATAAAMELDAIGDDEDPEVLAVEEKVTISGAFCGTSGTMSASYVVAEPSALFVGPRDTVLCKEAAMPCPGVKKFPKFTTIESQAGYAEFKGFEEPVGCKPSDMDLETQEEQGKPLYTKLMAWEFTCGECTVTTVSATSPVRIRTVWPFSFTARVTIEEAKLKFTCGADQCVFEKPEVSLTFIGGGPMPAQPYLYAEGVVLNANCAGWPKEITLWASYAVSSPSTVYPSRP